MWLKKTILLLLTTQLAFSQSNAVSLEEKINNAIDTFTSNPNPETLKVLENSQKSFFPKSEAEFAALYTLECNKAFYQNQFGSTNKAILSYEKAWRMYQKNQLYKYEIIDDCLRPLANLYTMIGDYDNAENTIKQYFYNAEIKKNQEQKFAAIKNLSVVYQYTGRINDAIDLLEKTIQSEKLSAVQKGILLTNLGNNYLLNANVKAENTYLTAVQLLKSDKDQTKIVSATYCNLAKIYSAKQQFERANSFMEKAVTKFFEVPNGKPREQAKLYYDSAIIDFQQGELENANTNLKAVFNTLLPNYSKSKSVLPDINSLYAETTLLDALDLHAQIYLAQNQPKKALESYQLSFHVEELLQSLLVYENSKIITQVRNRNRTEKCIEIYYSLYQKEKKISYIETAFALQEQTKSAVLKEAMFNKNNVSREEKLILEQLQNWNNIIKKEQQKLDYADISKINEAIQKQNELMLLLKSEEAKTKKETEKPFDIKTLYSKLEKDKAVMVAYFYGQEKTYSFTIENQTIKIQALGNKPKLDFVFYGFLNYFKDAEAIASNPKEYNQSANSVYTFLKLPNSKLNKNLIIIPDGILNFLPFEALISKNNNTTNIAKMHYLLQDFAIGYSNSASFYLNAIPFQHAKETVLGVFPIFENSTLELTFSKKELANLKAHFEGNFFEKDKATFANFKLNASNYSILHLSTHASSGDIDASASIKFYDQEVLYSELYNLNIQPNLVVLSACETGIGKWFKAEGAMSVARGFQFAGAQNLLFSLWKVNDFTTSVLMEKFYKNIDNGKSYFKATRQAKLDFLNDSSIPNAKKSPYYWSAFVYYGTLENNHSTTNYWLWIVGLIGLITLFLLLRKSFVTKFLPHKSQKKIKVSK